MSGLAGSALEDVDALGRQFVAGPPGAGQPAAAWGVVADGGLAHAGGWGRPGPAGDPAGQAPPDAHTIFRIASMTKSFTAAAALSLRDAGTLGLDDPVARWVPEVADWRGPTSDSPTLTVRHLLTMSGGLPTDNPWGDRQQATSAQDFAAFLRAGVRFAWAPGTAYEYSNLGYAILGRVLTAAAGIPYAELVSGRLLAPLGMASTSFIAPPVPPGRLATGHRVLDRQWQPVPFDGDGAFAPMGGLFSCVADLARWVAEYLDAFPPRDGAEGRHPLARSTRREQQQAHRVIPPRLVSTSVTTPVGLHGGSYGFGLVVEQDPELGQIVAHSGGYPGFGSHMRWHPGSGLGVVVLANSTYAAAPGVGARMLRSLLARTRATGSPAADGHIRVRDSLRACAPGTGSAWESTLEAMDAVEALLTAGWDEAAADRLFAMNVDLDEPRSRRRAALDSLRERFPGLARATVEPPEHDSPAHARWWLRGSGGAVRLEIRMTPHARPLVQALLATALPDPAPGGPLDLAVQALVDATAQPTRGWPATVAAGAGLDPGVAERLLRLAGDLAGPGRRGAPTGGDGVATLTLPVHGPRATLIWTVELDEAGAVGGFTVAHVDQGGASFD